MEYPFKDLLPLDEVLEREGYYKDWTHLDPKVFYSLTQISEYIKTKGFGVDVRLLIAQLAEHFSLKTSQINQIEQMFKDVMQELTEDKDFLSLPEIAGARDGFGTLGDRLERDYNEAKRDYNEVTAQLAQKVTKEEVNEAVSPKADISYVDSKVGAIDRGYGGTYATLSGLTNAHPNGNNRRYVVSDNGHWYYWNGSKWESGGVYQSSGIAENSVSPKEVNFASSIANLFDKNRVKKGGHYHSGNHQWVEYEGLSTSDFISCSAGDVIKVKVGSNFTNHYHIVFKNSQGNIFTGELLQPDDEGVISFTVPGAAVSFSHQVYDYGIDSMMIVKNAEPPKEYIPFGEIVSLNSNVKIKNDNLKGGITKDKIDFDTVGDYIDKSGENINLFDKSKVKRGGHYHSGNFQWVDYTGLSASDFISCSAGDAIKVKVGSNFTNFYHIVFKNSQGNIFDGRLLQPDDGGVIRFAIPATGVSFSHQVYDYGIDSMMIVKNAEPPKEYIPFGGMLTFKSNFKMALDKKEIDDNKIKDAVELDDYHPDRILVWEDDFDGTDLDKSSWTTLNRGDGVGGAHLEFNTDRSKNVRVEDGKLIITAIKENYKGRTWTGAQVNTNNLHEFKYGRIEAKIKLSSGQGFWPAFWTMGANYQLDADREGKVIGNGAYPYCGEIDIMEYYGTGSRTESRVHAPNAEPTGIDSSMIYYINGVRVTDYHVYAMEWDEDKIEFYVDDGLIGTYDIDDATINGDNPFRKPHYLMLNFAIRGTNPPNESTPKKGEMVVDWVRVYAPLGVSEYVNAESVSIFESNVNLTDDGRLYLGATPTLTPVDTLNMTVGEKIVLVEEIAPSTVSEHTAIWSSSDESVATCHGGVVQARGSGTCTVQVETVNFKKSTCIVNVE